MLQAPFDWACSWSVLESASYRPPFPRKPFTLQSKPSPKSNPSNNPSDDFSYTFTSKPIVSDSDENEGRNPLSQPICNYFKQSGHIIFNVLLWRKWEKDKNRRVLNLQGWPLYGQNIGHVLRMKFLSRPKFLILILLWRFMNHFYQMVLCH
jgi:hypothetical protein